MPVHRTAVPEGSASRPGRREVVPDVTHAR
jgi:hypothetical protein